MRLLTLKLFRHLHSHSLNNTLHGLEDEKIFEWSSMQRVLFKSPKLPSVLATLRYEAAHSMQIERPAKLRAKVVKRIDEESTVRGETSSEI